MHIEAVDTLALLELRAMVAQHLQAYGAFEGCPAADRRTILAQACLAIWHLTAGEEGRRLYLARLASVQAYVAAWRARVWQDGWLRLNGGRAVRA